MEVDVTYYTMRGVLSMECEDEWWRLVAYLSKSLNNIERNYKIHNKEMLTVIRGLENWRHLLKSTKFQGLDRPQEFRILHESTETEL